MAKQTEKEEKPKAIKQPVITDTPLVNEPPEGTCSKEDFDHLRSKGFIPDMVTHNYVNFFKRTTEANTCVNIRWEDNKWKCAVFRAWDTRNHDYDASFSPAYNTLDELLEKVSDDFEARAKIVQSLKR